MRLVFIIYYFHYFLVCKLAMKLSRGVWFVLICLRTSLFLLPLCLPICCMESGYSVDVNKQSCCFCSFRLKTYCHYPPNYLLYLRIFKKFFYYSLQLHIVLGIIPVWTISSFYCLLYAGNIPSTVVLTLNFFFFQLKYNLHTIKFTLLKYRIQ